MIQNNSTMSTASVANTFKEELRSRNRNEAHNFSGAGATRYCSFWWNLGCNAMQLRLSKPDVQNKWITKNVTVSYFSNAIS
jgi:hypothetical protein